MFTVSEVNPTYFTASQITAEQIESVIAGKYKTIISFRPDGEEESQPLTSELSVKAKELGIVFHHVPMKTPTDISQESLQQMCTILQSSPTPILGFCRSGRRATVLYEKASKECPATPQ